MKHSRNQSEFGITTVKTARSPNQNLERFVIFLRIELLVLLNYGLISSEKRQLNYGTHLVFKGGFVFRNFRENLIIIL